jgi:hypothetical protein
LILISVDAGDVVHCGWYEWRYEPIYVHKPLVLYVQAFMSGCKGKKSISLYNSLHGLSPCSPYWEKEKMAFYCLLYRSTEFWTLFISRQLDFAGDQLSAPLGKFAHIWILDVYYCTYMRVPSSVMQVLKEIVVSFDGDLNGM